MNTKFKIVFVCQNKETKQYVCFDNGGEDGKWDSFDIQNTIKYLTPNFDEVRNDLFFMLEKGKWEQLLPKLIWHTLTIETSWSMTQLQ